jgi:hypothetical protein
MSENKPTEGRQKKIERARKQQQLKAKREAQRTLDDGRLKPGQFEEAAASESGCLDVHDYYDLYDDIKPEEIAYTDLDRVTPNTREKAENLLKGIARVAPTRSQKGIVDEFKLECPTNCPTYEMITARAHSFVWTPGDDQRNSNPTFLFNVNNNNNNNNNNKVAPALNSLLRDPRYLAVEDKLSTDDMMPEENISLALLINHISTLLGAHFEQIIGGSAAAAAAVLKPSQMQADKLPPNHVMSFWHSKDEVREIMMAIVFIVKMSNDSEAAEVLTHFYIPPICS